jgi:hypothetical protein
MGSPVSLQQVVRLAGMAVLLAALLIGTGRQVNANQSGPTVNETSGFQQRLCELGGGTASVDPDRTVGSGLQGVWVTCKGGLFNGLHCSNTVSRPPHCFWEAPPPGDQNFNDLPEIETEIVTVDPGTVDDIEVTEDIQPMETIVPVEDPVIDDETVDPLPPVVDESPLDETIPDVDVVEADQVVTDEPLQDLPGLESDVPVIPIQEIPEEVPAFEPAP